MFCLIFILFFFFFSSRRRHTRCSRDWSSDVCSSDLVGGRWSNELITSYERLRDDCVPNATFPRIGVRADVGQLFAGPNFTCATDTVAQDVLEVTDNVTFAAGRHLITLGTHGELLHVRDGVLLQGSGVWGFTNLDSLARGRAMRYDRGLPGPLYPAVGPEVDFHVRQVGVYAQDSWDAGRRLALTAGLRVGIHGFPGAAGTNSAGRDSLGLDPRSGGGRGGEKGRSRGAADPLKKK